MNPLLALRPLPAHVEHAEPGLLDDELDLDDAGRLHAGPQHVLVARHVVGAAQPADVGEEVLRRVVELETVPARVDSLWGNNQHALYSVVNM